MLNGSTLVGDVNSKDGFFICCTLSHTRADFYPQTASIKGLSSVSISAWKYSKIQYFDCVKRSADIHISGYQQCLVSRSFEIFKIKCWLLDLEEVRVNINQDSRGCSFFKNGLNWLREHSFEIQARHGDAPYSNSSWCRIRINENVESSAYANSGSSP